MFGVFCVSALRVPLPVLLWFAVFLGCAGFWVVGCCDTLSGCVVGLILLGLGLVLWLSWFGWVLVFVVGFVCMLFSMLAFAIQDFGLVILVVLRRFWW